MDGLAEMVRAGDRERYTASLYAPENKRNALLALYAFNIEIARIRDLTNEPMVGEMRLLWWRDAIVGGSSTETAGHPIAEVLCGAISDNGLPVAAFENMIEARRFDLYNDPMPSRNDLEGYCGETAGALIQLSALVLDADAAATHADAAGHAGCAQAIAGLLSLLPHHAARGQCFVPSDVLAAAGASVEEFTAGEPGASAENAVAAMLALGREHLSAFEALARDLPATLRPAFLPVAATGAWFHKLERAGKQVFEHPVKPSPLRLSAAIFRRAMFGWR